MEYIEEYHLQRHTNLPKDLLSIVPSNETENVNNQATKELSDFLNVPTHLSTNADEKHQENSRKRKFEDDETPIGPKRMKMKHIEGDIMKVTPIKIETKRFHDMNQINGFWTESVNEIFNRVCSNDEFKDKDLISLLRSVRNFRNDNELQVCSQLLSNIL